MTENLSDEDARYIANNYDAMGTNLLRANLQRALATIAEDRARIQDARFEIDGLKSSLESAEISRNAWKDSARIAMASAEEAEARIAVLAEWKKSVSTAVQNIPEFHSDQWGGDKDGWGFHFELINWLQRKRIALEAAQLPAGCVAVCSVCKGDPAKPCMNIPIIAAQILHQDFMAGEINASTIMTRAEALCPLRPTTSLPSDAEAV